MYHLDEFVRNRKSGCNKQDVLCPPFSNSIYLALSNPILYSLPPGVFFSPRFATASHRERMCSFGTRSSFKPLNMRIGVVEGIRGILDIESHF
jgi:hypothetical protein